MVAAAVPDSVTYIWLPVFLYYAQYVLCSRAQSEKLRNPTGNAADTLWAVCTHTYVPGHTGLILVCIILSYPGRRLLTEQMRQTVLSMEINAICLQALRWSKHKLSVITSCSCLCLVAT